MSKGWFYEGKEFGYDDFVEKTEKGFIGFVYCTTDLKSGNKYIGKKEFFRKKILPVTKTRKRRKHTRVESNWQDYYGSSPMIMEKVSLGDTDRFARTILLFGKTKGDLSYLEAKMQFDHDVLAKDSYINGIINCRISKSHLSEELRKELSNDN